MTAFMWVFQREGQWRCALCLDAVTLQQASFTWPDETGALTFGRAQARQAADRNGVTTHLYRADPEQPAPPESTAEIICPLQQ